MESVIPPEHREWVERLRHGGPIPLDCLHSASNCWACPPCHTFSVRGPDYMHTKAKIPAADSLLQPLACHLLQGPSQISHIMNHPYSPVRAALDAAAAVCANPDPPARGGQQLHHPFVWAFNFQLGTKAHHSLISYFVSFSSPPQGSLQQKFLDGDDAFRNARLKLLTRFPEAPRLVQMALGERWPVCTLGKHMKCTYIRGKHYMEVDVDVGSSMLTRSIVNLTTGFTRLMVTDLAFVLEGTHPDELPERILGAVRVVRLEPSSAPHIDMSEEVKHEDMLSTVPKGMKLAKSAMLSSSSSRIHVLTKKAKEVKDN